jgi:hypothetical protein
MLGSARTRATVVLGVALIAAACGGSDFSRRTVVPAGNDVSPTPPTVVTRNPALQAKLTRSVGATSAARTARTSISVTLTGLGDDSLTTGAYDIAGTGVVDFVKRDADLSLSIPLLDRLGGGGAVEERIVGGVVYTKMPAGVLRAAGLPATVRWLSLDPKHAAGADPSALSQSQVDPAGQLAFLAAVSDDVRTIGDEPVRSVATTHYAATIDRVLDSRGEARMAALRAKVAQLRSAIGARGLALDAWLDRDGRVRRIVVSVPLAPRSGAVAADDVGPDATLRIQSDFYAFGTAVRVAAPPQSQTRPYGTLRIGS